MKTSLIYLFAVLTIAPVFADSQIEPDKRRSLIDSDPEVIYVADLLDEDESVELSVTKPGVVYSTKKGGRKLGQISSGKVKLIGFDDRACKVQGQGKTGWVRSDILESEKGNIEELLKTVYEREMTVKNLIAEGEIALGMTRDEVCRVYGQPTKQKMRRTAKGLSGSMEFIEFEELKHYETVRDNINRSSFQRYTHTTQEETSKVVVEFADDVASAIEESENEEAGNVRIVSRPVVYFW